MNNDALIIDDLHHRYDKRESSNWILNEINLKIENGELLGLLGPSGCGKTTLSVSYTHLTLPTTPYV